MRGVDGQVETYPGFTVAFEAFDVAGAQRGGFRPGVEFGRDFEIDAVKRSVFVEALHGFFPRGGEAGQAKQSKKGGERLESHKSWCAAFRYRFRCPHNRAQAPACAWQLFMASRTKTRKCGRHSSTVVLWRQRLGQGVARSKDRSLRQLLHLDLRAPCRSCRRLRSF